MRRSDHAEELYERSVRFLLGNGTVQERLARAAAEIAVLQPAGMSGEIQRAHDQLMADLGSHANIADMPSTTAVKVAMQLVEVFVLVRLHHGE